MKRILAFVLSLMMVLSIVSCGEKPVDSSAETTVSTLETTQTTANETTTEATTTEETTTADATLLAKTSYQDAVIKTRDLKDVTLQITVETYRETGVQQFYEAKHQTVHLRHMGGDDFTFSAVDTVDMGNNRMQMQKYYANGVYYIQIGKDKYCADATAEDIMGLYIPAVAVSAANYDSCKTVGNTYYFTDANAAESYLTSDFGMAIQADATVTVNGDGVIEKSVYNAEYLLGASYCNSEITVSVEKGVPEELQAPADADTYKKITSYMAPEMMALSFAGIMMTKNVTYHGKTEISSGLFNIRESEEMTAYMANADGSCLYSDETVYTIIDNFKGPISTDTVKKSYADGVLHLDFGDETLDAERTDEQIMGYVYSMLSHDSAYHHDVVEDMEFSMEDGLAVITVSRNDGEERWKNYIHAIAQTPDEIIKDTRNIRVSQNQVILYLDVCTGVPISISEELSIRHTTDNFGYNFDEHKHISIRYYGAEPYETITGNPYPYTEPKDKAEPLFYHVTSKEGKDMWLLGTIHIGDERTMYLPKELMDAYASSDAVALELDLEKAEKEIEENPELAMEYAKNMMYLDGSTLQDHLGDDETFAKIVHLFHRLHMYDEAAGIFVMKPMAVTEMLAEIYRDIGGALSADRGADMQFLKKAKADGKKIIELETMKEQMELMTKIPDEEQIADLLDFISMDVPNVMMEERLLYEYWCDGNFQMLQMLLNSESEGFDEHVSDNRNVKMLAKCEEFLAGDETVFYAVGLAHLIDTETGLVKALTEKGYTVEQVVYS